MSCAANQTCCGVIAGTSVTYQCQGANTMCTGVNKRCDSREDCTANQVCCANIAITPGGMFGVTISCTTAALCPAGMTTYVLCKTSADCPAGRTNCCPMGAMGIAEFACSATPCP